MRLRSLIMGAVIVLALGQLSATGCSKDDRAAKSPSERPESTRRVTEVSRPSMRGGTDQTGPATSQARTTSARVEKTEARTPTENVASSPSERLVANAEEATPPVTYRHAETAYLAGDYRGATDLFTAYVSQKPKNPWGHYMLGLSARHAGRPEIAEKAFHAALVIDPTHSKSRLNLARVLLDEDRPGEALAQVDSALSADPYSADAHRLRGRGYTELGRIDEAIDSYRLALTLDEGDAWAMNNLGLLLIQQQLFEEALPLVVRATELRQDVAIFQNNLGVVLERLGYSAEAKQAFARARELDPGHEQAATSLARLEARPSVASAKTLDHEAASAEFVEMVNGWRRAGPETDLSMANTDLATKEKTSPAE